MKTYRCKHAVEAMRWTDTDANREAFSAWFESHNVMFETRGPIALLPDLQTRKDPDDSSASVDTYDVQPGEWILFSDGEFIAMEDELFWDTEEHIGIHRPRVQRLGSPPIRGRQTGKADRRTGTDRRFDKRRLGDKSHALVASRNKIPTVPTDTKGSSK